MTALYFNRSCSDDERRGQLYRAGYPFVADNAMALFPDYWDRPVRNSSNEFNYQDWSQGRA